MKPAAFDLARPASLAEACALLATSGDNARAIAGGQSLGPMLNLRLATPALLVPLAPLAELAGAQETATAITLGASVTHAAIADGLVPDLPPGGILAGIAAHIAYRAVRNRGTIGGSLCHADPAADWPCTLSALGAVALTSDATGGQRDIPLDDFLLGAYRTALRPGEILYAVRIPKPGAGARFGYHKSCRKPGEFAHAMAAVLDDPGRGIRRIAIGATGGRLLRAATADAALAALASCGLDLVAQQMQRAALRQALQRAGLA